MKDKTVSKGKKVTVKSHSRRNRSGKRIIVKSYSRHAHGRGFSKKHGASSGTEFESRKKHSSYGDFITKRLHTFQGSVEDGLSSAKRKIGDKLKERKRKLKEYINNKELNRVEKSIDKFLKKHGYTYKKYL